MANTNNILSEQDIRRELKGVKYVSVVSRHETSHLGEPVVVACVEVESGEDLEQRLYTRNGKPHFRRSSKREAGVLLGAHYCNGSCYESATDFDYEGLERDLAGIFMSAVPAKVEEGVQLTRESNNLLGVVNALQECAASYEAEADTGLMRDAVTVRRDYATAKRIYDVLARIAPETRRNEFAEKSAEMMELYASAPVPVFKMHACCLG